jgi:mono/diheme cytochrome c family protein
MQNGVTWKNLSILVLTLGLAGSWIADAPAYDEANFPMPYGKTYFAECGSCHTAYAPGLLPARSWRKMMGELGQHFGEDASLQEPERLAILKELEDMAADGAYADMRMRRIAAGIAPEAAPQRIVDTEFFKYMHDEVPSSFWRRKEIGSSSNCIACHTHANEGQYREWELRIPQ